MENGNLVQTTQRSLDIIEALRRLDGALLTEIAAALDLPNSTVHNHLSTLADRGYVVRDSDDVYRLSLQFLDVGEYTRSRRKIYKIARPEVDKLAEETGEATNLLVEEDGRGVYIYTAQGEQSVPLDIYAGKRVHLHETAIGKCILAYLPEARIRQIAEQWGLPARTENTITDLDRLLSELEAIREQGYAVDREERAAGIYCVAAPVRGEDGRILGAISVSGPSSKLAGDDIIEAYVDELHSTTNVVELKVAYS